MHRQQAFDLLLSVIDTLDIDPDTKTAWMDKLSAGTFTDTDFDAVMAALAKEIKTLEEETGKPPKK